MCTSPPDIALLNEQGVWPEECNTTLAEQACTAQVSRKHSSQQWQDVISKPTSKGCSSIAGAANMHGVSGRVCCSCSSTCVRVLRGGGVDLHSCYCDCIQFNSMLHLIAYYATGCYCESIHYFLTLHPHAQSGAFCDASLPVGSLCLRSASILVVQPA